MNRSFADSRDFLEWLHAAYHPRTYVEVGAGKGDLLTLARWSLNVAIDPDLDVVYPLDRTARLFPLPVPEFFARHDLVGELAGQHVDVALVRGPISADEALTHLERLVPACAAGSLLLLECPVERTEKQDPTATASEPALEAFVSRLPRDSTWRIATVPAGADRLVLIRDLGPEVHSGNGNSGADQEVPTLESAEAVQAFLGPQPYQLSGTPRLSARTQGKWAAGVKLFVRSPARALTYALSRRRRPRALGVLLCYNDADVLGDAIEALRDNHHDVIAWDHGSDDGTAAVLDAHAADLVERRYLPRDFDFYKLYETMSRNLLDNYVKQYDWISWPDQDEILEGPWRDQSYYDYVTEAFNYSFDWVQFNNFNYWFTGEDNPNINSPVRRIKRYALFADCAPRIRSWRASATNIRHFNHNPPRGKKFPIQFNLRHYPMRSHAQMLRRIYKDRGDIQRGEANYHYNNMKAAIDRMLIPAQRLHYDDGRQDLNHEVVFPWRQEIYGDHIQAAKS